MPYIKQEDRKYLNDLIDQLSEQIQEVLVADSGYDYWTHVGGFLNYTVTKLLKNALAFPFDSGTQHLQPEQMRSLTYANMERLVGMLDNCKAELRRRYLDPYEDEKIKENGDV